MSLRVHIERLILDGLPLSPAERPRLGAAVEAELSRLLAEGQLAPELRGGGAVPTLRAEGIAVQGQPSASDLGAQIARAVYGSLGRRS